MSFPRSVVFVVILAAGAAGVAGCFLEGTAFEGAGGAAGGSGGGGGGGGNGAGNEGAGASGTTTSTGSTASTNVTTSTGGTTSSTMTSTSTCTLDTDCPDPDPNSICLEPRCASGVCTDLKAHGGEVCGGSVGDCHALPTCVDGECLAEPLGSGTELPDSNFEDCLKPVCNGEGSAENVPDDSQAPQSTKCKSKGCMNGAVTSEPQNEGEDCFQGIATCCDGKCCDGFACLVCGG